MGFNVFFSFLKQLNNIFTLKINFKKTLVKEPLSLFILSFKKKTIIKLLKGSSVIDLI